MDNNSQPFKVINLPQGAGKSITAHEYALYNLKNAVFMHDDHRQGLGHLVDLISNRNFAIDPSLKYELRSLIGSTKEIKNIIARAYLFNKDIRFLCSLYKNHPYLWRLKCCGFLPTNFCREMCMYRETCLHRINLIETLNLHKFQNKYDSLLIYTVKHYITKSNVLETLITKFKNQHIFMDESLLNMAIDQLILKPTQIGEFRKRFIPAMSNPFHKIILNFYKHQDIHTIQIALHEIQNHLENPNFKKNKKRNEVIKTITGLIDNFGKNTYVKLQELNEQFKKYLESRRGTLYEDFLLSKSKSGKRVFLFHNLFNRFIRIVEIIENLENDMEKLQKRVGVDNDCNFFAITSNIPRFEYIIDNSHLIVLDATTTVDRIKYMFPTYYENDDIAFFPYNQTIKIPTQKAYIYRMNNKKYGKYSKLDINPSSKKKKNKDRFNKFVNYVKQTIEYEVKYLGGYKGIIAIFKDYKPYLWKQIKNLVKQLQAEYDEVEVIIEWWYNIAGVNLYQYFDWALAFGGPGRPKQFLEILADITHIPYNELYTWSTKDELLQFIERLRCLLFPYQKRIYLLTNILMGIFENEMNWNGTFPIIEFKDLFNYLKQNNGIDIKTAIKFIKKSDKIRKEVLDNLVTEGYLQYELASQDRGRPKHWYFLAT